MQAAIFNKLTILFLTLNQTAFNQLNILENLLDWLSCLQRFILQICLKVSLYICSLTSVLEQTKSSAIRFILFAQKHGKHNEQNHKNRNEFSTTLDRIGQEGAASLTWGQAAFECRAEPSETLANALWDIGP